MMRKLLFLLMSILITICVIDTNAQNTPVAPSSIKTAIYFDVTGPIKNLPPLTEEQKQIMAENAAKRNLNKGLGDRVYPFADQVNPPGPDPVWQKEMGKVSSGKAPILNFAGQTSPYYPPDCNGDVGPNHYFQAVNTTYAIYDKSGNQVVASTAYNTLFSGVTGSSDNDGDPIILYDEMADRWMAAEFSVSGSNDYMLIAVSVTNDPTGSWYRWSFDVDDMPDYMKFGVQRDGYYMATNTYNGLNNAYVFERDVMLSGGSSPQMIGFPNPWRPSGFHCIQPLDCDGAFPPIGTPGQFITINDNAIGGGSDQLFIFQLNANWSSPGSSTFNRVQQIGVSSFESEFNSWGVGDITQPGTSQKLDAIPMILMYRAQYRSFGTSQSIVCSHTVDVNGANQAGIRWYELENTGSTWSIRQEGTYAPDGNSRWMGSIAMNANHEIAIGYSISSSSVYPGIRYCGQSSSENALASGIMDIAEEVIISGTTSQTSANRWGDYSLITVDPTNNETFWYTTEYLSSGGSRLTRIASFELATPTLTAGFTGIPTTVSVGGTVTFTDASVGGATTWNWSFPGGSPASHVGQNPPSITYSIAGSYNVILTVTDGASGSDTETKINYITVANLSSTTYTSGDISTDFGFQSLPGSSTCPGSLTVNIPVGATITGVDVEYAMTAISSESAWMSEQRSLLRCTSTGGTAEGTLYSGSGDAAGTQSYSRIGLTIANGVTGGGNISFQLHAGRTWGGSGCNTTYNKVDNNTWTIIVYYSPVVANPVADFSSDNLNPAIGQTVTFTDASLNSPTSWAWSFNPSTVTYVNSTTSSSQNPQVTFDALGFYTVSLTASNSSGNDTETKTDYINVPLSYCNASGGSVYLHISRVQLGDIDNSTGQDSYFDYTSLSTDIRLNQAYNIIITNGEPYDQNDLGIWIDWNQNGNLDDAGENIVCDIDNYGQGTFNFTVPGTALTGTTLMRIRTKFNGSDCGSPCGTTTYGEVEDYSVNIIAAVPGLWIGTSSSDWNIASNWSDSNIPVTGIDVTIPTSLSGGNYPETNTGAGAVCNNLTIESGAHLEIPSNNTLTVNGALTNNAGTNGLIINSDATGTGSLIHSTSGVEATVERYLTDGRWHFIGMPISSSMVDVFHLPAGHSDIYLRTHIEATNQWDAYIVPLGTPLALGRGYETWVGTPNGFSQPETIEFTGALNTGDYTTGSGSFYGLQYTTGRGLNLIANPYPSALEGNIDTWTKSNVNNSIWTWSDTHGNYVYWGSGNDYGEGLFGSMTNGVIPAMQAFFVEAKRANPSPYITIPQTDRIHSSQAYYKESEIPANTLQLDVKANDYKDVIFITFNEQATDDYDDFDVKKLFGLVEAPQLYSKITDEQLSINALPQLSEYRTVQLGFECGLPGIYTINASEIESFNSSVSVYLEDTKEGIIQNLSSEVSYTFTYDLTDESTRFVLHFGSPNGIGSSEGQNVRVYANGNIVYIQKPTGMNGNISIYDMLGQEILSQKADNGGLISIPVTNGMGYYVVKIQSDDRILTQKVFIR